MKRIFFVTLLTSAVLAWPAQAQSDGSGSDGGTSDAGLADRSPLENARGGRVSERAPGNWVREAIARHNGFIDERVNAPRSGNQPNNESASGGGASASSSGSGLSGLAGLADQFLGGLGSLGGLSSIGSMLGGGGARTGTTTGTTGTTGAAGSSGMTIEDLLALRDAMAAAEGESVVNGVQINKSDQRQQSQSTSQFGGAIARLPKAEDRFQETTEERKFGARLLEAWADTLFAALTLGFQSNSFVDLIKDGLRPLILPAVSDGTDAGADDGSGDGTGDGSGDGDTGGSGDSPGGSVDDLSPPDGGGDSGDSGSII